MAPKPLSLHGNWNRSSLIHHPSVAFGTANLFGSSTPNCTSTAMIPSTVTATQFHTDFATVTRIDMIATTTSSVSTAMPSVQTKAGPTSGLSRSQASGVTAATVLSFALIVVLLTYFGCRRSTRQQYTHISDPHPPPIARVSPLDQSPYWRNRQAGSYSAIDNSRAEEIVETDDVHGLDPAALQPSRSPHRSLHSPRPGDASPRSEGSITDDILEIYEDAWFDDDTPERTPHLQARRSLPTSVAPSLPFNSAFSSSSSEIDPNSMGYRRATIALLEYAGGHIRSSIRRPFTS
jgi:hypothetical protein